MVFKKFREFGSARQITLWCHEEKIRLPILVPGTHGRKIRWCLPTSGRVLQILRNPCYAGAFAYGRTETKTVIHEGRARRCSRSSRPIEQWKVLILNHHKGYITWEEYLSNRRMQEENLARRGSETSSGAGTGVFVRSAALWSLRPHDAGGLQRIERSCTSLCRCWWTCRARFESLLDRGWPPCGSSRGIPVSTF
jgi:hypothetical protein